VNAVIFYLILREIKIVYPLKTMKINSLEMIAEKIISVITIERDAYTANWICTVYNEKYTV